MAPRQNIIGPGYTLGDPGYTLSGLTPSPTSLPSTEQVFVEALERHFKNVCELDIIFNVEQVHWVVDEMVVL
mgnify:CR=1 FL=1